MSQTPEINDGGPAFSAATCGDWQHGMSLRDWFAGQALSGYIRHYSMDDQPLSKCQHEIARECYAISDAMLKARSK